VVFRRLPSRGRARLTGRARPRQALAEAEVDALQQSIAGLDRLDLATLRELRMKEEKVHVQIAREAQPCARGDWMDGGRTGTFLFLSRYGTGTFLFLGRYGTGTFSLLAVIDIGDAGRRARR
jgi:hypothetical protein